MTNEHSPRVGDTATQQNELMLVQPDPALLQKIYEQAVRRYIEQRKAKIAEFVDTHYSFKGSLQLHRHSLGWDMLKAPVNAVAGLLTAVKLVGASGARWLGAKEFANSLDRTNLFLDTKLGQELSWALYTQWLELPYQQGTKVYGGDALLTEIVRDPLIEQQLLYTLEALLPHRDDPKFTQRLTELLCQYVGTRTAAADISVSLMSAAAGMATLHKLTPGVAALSATMASSMAHTAALHSFWAGPWAGSLYYSIVSLSTPHLLTAGIFAGLLIPASALAAFAGVLADPVQRRLGIHHKRLRTMTDSVEQALLGENELPMIMRDHYVARIFDLLDWTQVVVRLAK